VSDGHFVSGWIREIDLSDYTIFRCSVCLRETGVFRDNDAVCIVCGPGTLQRIKSSAPPSGLDLEEEA
jgi:hypothetical protein